MSKPLRTMLTIFLGLLLALCVPPSALAAELEASSGDREAAADPESSFPFVTFLCDQVQELRGLSVYDAAGKLCDPLTDAESGEARYGSYQLQAGEYRYVFHDDEGLYEDLEASFSVNAGVYAYFLRLSLTPVREIYSFSYTYINPFYADVIRESDIPKVSDSEEEQIEELLAFAAELESSGSGSSDRYYAESGIRHATVEEAGKELKKQIMDFEETATIRLLVDSEPTVYDWQNFTKEIFAAAIAHTGTPTEGDYLRYEYGGYNAGGSILTEDDKYVCLFKYSLFHFTTSEQEDELTEEVDRLLSALALDGKSDYEKIRAIYDYLCANVSYGGSGNLINTAYGALINHLCVCQGYSAAFYRLCLASGIDTRVITRTGNPGNHAWNIVRLGGQYYEADATWDHEHYGKAYLYFLKGSSDWLTSTHNTLGDQFSDSAFSARYTLPTYNYVSYDIPELENELTGVDDFVASISARQADGNIERFRVALAADPVESGLGGVCAFEVYPRVAAYSGESILAQEMVGDHLLVEGSVFSVSLPVPESWAERQAVYTLTGEGYDDVSDSVEIRGDGDGFVAQIDNLPHLGHFSLALLCRINFDPGNGLPAETILAQAGTPVEKPADPTREGCWFGGWFAAGSEEPFDFEDTLITADSSLSAKWFVPDFVLPDALAEIGDEAFAGGAFRFVKLSERTTAIGRHAFADCPNLAYIYLPEGILSIDSEAFGDLSDLTVFGKAGSAAEEFAEDMHFHFVAVS